MTPAQLPREKIPWFPSIDAGRCTGCRICLDFCPNGVFGWDEAGNVAVVEKPYSCVVGCSGCLDKCPVRAIAFPDWPAVRALIEQLRREARGGA